MSFDPAWTTALGWSLLHFLWQGALVGLATATALALMGRARPQARYALACAALALCLLLPAWQLALEWPRADAGPDALVTGMPASAGDDGIAADGMGRAFAGRAHHWRERLQPRLPTLVALWSLGTALMALRLGLGLAWIARLGRDGRGRGDHHWQARLDALAIRLGLHRTVRLRLVDDLDSPVAARFWRPLVLVPAALVARMPSDLLEALLAHELAHIRRHDYLVNLMQSVVEALLFYHPVVWWLSRRIRIEREQIADDLAADALGNPRQLALALDQLAQWRVATPHLAPAAHGGNLMSRIERLVRPRPASTLGALTLPLMGLGAMSLSLFAFASAPEAAITRPEASSITRFGLLDQDGDGVNFSIAASDDYETLKQLRRRIEGDALWFHREGRDYLVRDPSLVDRFRAAWQPVEALGKEMGVLGKQMEVEGKAMEAVAARMEASLPDSRELEAHMKALGKEMEATGRRMEPLYDRQARATDEVERQRLSGELDTLNALMLEQSRRMEGLGKEMEQLHAPLQAMQVEMEAASKPMEALSRQMEGLGKRMEQLNLVARAQALEVLEQSLRDGRAEPVEPDQGLR